MIPDTFDQILLNGGVIVGLRRHEARARYSLQKLHEAGFQNIELVYGIDGFHDDVAEAERRLDCKIQKYLGPGEIGNTLSFIHLWRKVERENLPYLLMFEDDVLPHPDIRQLGPLYWNETPRDFDFLFLGSQCGVPADQAGRRVISAPSFCFHACMVSNAGAKKVGRYIDELSRGPGVDKGDCQMIQWMRKQALTWYNWNAQNLVPFPYPVSNGAKSGDQDTIWRGRDNGLFYQNYKLGSTIHARDVVHE